MGDGAAKGPGRCQGLTVWSLEGQEYPQDISYIGAPDMLSTLAPEMDAIADRACSFQCNTRLYAAGTTGGMGGGGAAEIIYCV